MKLSGIAKQSLYLAILLATCGSFSVAQSLVSAVQSGAPEQPEMHAPPPPMEATGEGTTWRSIVGENKTGINVDLILDTSVSINNTSDSSQHGAGGTANYPVGAPGDKGFELSDIWTFIHRDLKANFMPRVTPLPSPMYKKFDWGFEVDTQYGRNAQPCPMPGWDNHWGVNEPGASNPSLAAANKQNFFCTPFTEAVIYLPIFKGISITGGRYGDGLGFEIPPNPANGPNFFYSHTYAMTSQTWQVLGVLVSANVFHSQKNGYLLAEFGLNNGEQTAVSPSGNTMQSFEGALRWKSPRMNTGVAYSFRAGNGNIKTNAQGNPINSTDFGPLYHLYSPVGQLRQRHNLVITHVFNRHWNAEAEGVYFNQAGDKKATTILEWPGGGPNFGGAHAAGINGRVIYQFNPRLAAGVRLETFNDPSGYWDAPLNVYSTKNGAQMSRGRFNDFTAGVNYSPVKFIKFRPEIRYDWNNNGAYGTGNASVINGTSNPQKGQLLWDMDMLVRF